MDKNMLQNMTDADLLTLVQGGDYAANDAVDVFFARYAKPIEKKALWLCHVIPFDASLSEEELRLTAVSEAYLVAKSVMMKHDCSKSAFMTNFENRLKWHFQDLQRANCRHDEVERPIGNYADRKDFNDRMTGDSDSYESTDRLEFAVSHSAQADAERRAEMKSAWKRIAKHLTAGSKEQKVYRAFEESADSDCGVFEAAGKAMECTRATVYNRRDSMLDRLPGALKGEIVELLRLSAAA